MNEDQNLIEKIRTEGAKGLEGIYTELREEFIVWLMKTYACTFEEAEEHFQFSILTLYENIVNGKLVMLTSTLKTYLFSIGKNKALELVKSDKRWGVKLETYQNIVVEDELRDFQAEDWNLSLAENSLIKLGDPCKTMLQLYYYHKRSMEEISVEMGYKNPTTTKNLKYKCLQRLRKIFRNSMIAEH